MKIFWKTFESWTVLYAACYIMAMLVAFRAWLSTWLDRCLMYGPDIDNAYLERFSTVTIFLRLHPLHAFVFFLLFWHFASLLCMYFNYENPATAVAKHPFYVVTRMSTSTRRNKNQKKFHSQTKPSQGLFSELYAVPKPLSQSCAMRCSCNDL